MLFCLLILSTNDVPKRKKRLSSSVDCIAFIKMRYQRVKSQLSHEGFVGMWRDRAEIQNSTEWVKNNRQAQWA